MLTRTLLARCLPTHSPQLLGSLGAQEVFIPLLVQSFNGKNGKYLAGAIMNPSGTPEPGTQFFLRYDSTGSASGALTALPKTANSECGFASAK